MKTIFIRALEESKDKNKAIIEAIQCSEDVIGRTRFEVDPKEFNGIPGSPFAYWATGSTRALFSELPPFESGGRIARLGGGTKSDFRFIRLAWEVYGGPWKPLAKGGAFGRFYSDIYLQVNWGQNAREIEAELLRKYPYLGANADFVLHRGNPYFHPGITWPRRTKSPFSPRVLPAGCIFSDQGPSAFETDGQSSTLLQLLAIMSSTTFRGLIELQLAAADARAGGAARTYEVGIIQRTPLPGTTEKELPLGVWAETAWSLQRILDTTQEESHAFNGPSLARARKGSLALSAGEWLTRCSKIRSDLINLQGKIDGCVANAYGLALGDRENMETLLHPGPNSMGDLDGKPHGQTDAHLSAQVIDLISWAAGVAFGRFDIRLATGERPATPESEPFESLPVCSPGMLAGDDGFPLNAPPAGYPIEFPSDGIVVDDRGADRDLISRVRQVFEAIFDEPVARLEEAGAVLGDRDHPLRSWFVREFFGLHIRRYSKSRRKAPIYWQLATPSTSYSAWLYYHRFTRDTLFRLLNDHVAPKLQHEESKLTSLTQDAGLNPTTSQRNEIDDQETFVGELRAFRDEVARVAPLWNPNLNDGVILNFAPLWRLVPQHKAWQKECKSAWDKLCKGDYDWAHLAMHLWPERVVPKCAKDRSLAIAHGLEQVFWEEDTEGKWQKRTVGGNTSEQLIKERTVPAVKAALDELKSAPAPTGGRRRRTRP